MTTLITIILLLIGIPFVLLVGFLLLCGIIASKLGRDE